MTDITLDKEKAKIPKSLTTLLYKVMLIAGLFGSSSLFTDASATTIVPIASELAAPTISLPVSKVSETTETTTPDTPVEPSIAQKRQLACLARNVYHEAKSESFDSMVGVAQVTMNRVESGKFPKSVCEVVYQKNVFYERVICQFSWYCSHAATVKPINTEQYAASMAVAKKVLIEGLRIPQLKHALFYHSNLISPKWKRNRITQFGNHIFYR